MVTLKEAIFAAVGMIVMVLGVAAPAGADPVNDPCQLAVTVLCRFMPIAPNLEDDIDLTQGPATVNGQLLPQMPAAG